MKYVALLSLAVGLALLAEHAPQIFAALVR
jgi:hypothetical protein